MSRFTRKLGIVIVVLLTTFTSAGNSTVLAANSSTSGLLRNDHNETVSSKKVDITPTTLEENLTGNLWIQTTASDFNKGANQGTVITTGADGEIKLAQNQGSYVSGGIYTSETVLTSPFQYLILSWNADTPKGTSIQIEGQARIGTRWSGWLSWGTWSSSSERYSVSNNSDKYAYVDVDTFTIKKGATADAFRYRVTLITSDPAATPSVRQMTAALYNSLPGQSIGKVYNDGITQDQLNNLNTTLNVPQYSQLIRDPQFAWSICSPTSIAMLLKYRGVDIVPEQSAMGVYDSVYNGYGNWPFNVAYAGSYGYTTYVDYMTGLDDLKREIIKGNPAAVSVKYKNDESVSAPYPVVHGAPIASTGGHFIVVCGFTKGADGKDYVVVNDPAASSDAGVRLQYLASEFDAAWATSGRVTYAIHPMIPGDGTAAPQILQSSLTATGNTRTTNGVLYKEYQLTYNGQMVSIATMGSASAESGISIMYSKDGGAYEYITPSTDQTLWFNTTKPVGTYNFLVFKKTGDSYSAQINWSGN